MNEQYPNAKIGRIHYMVIDATNEARAERRYFTLYCVFSKKNLGPGLR